jgi:hypothetical protein
MDNLLKNLGATIGSIENIENRLFSVVKKPLITGVNGFNTPELYGTFKEHGSNCFGVVKEGYTPTQPKAIFEAILDGCQAANINPELIRFKEIKDGAKVVFSFPIDTIEFLNARKINDITNLYGQIITGFDGETISAMSIFSDRLVCTNGMRKRVTEFKAGFKNTAGNEGKIAGMLSDILRVIGSIKDVKDMYLHLNSVSVDTKAVEAYIERVSGYNLTEYDELGKKSRTTIDNIRESIEIEISRTGATYFGLFNGFTHYVNHVQNGNDNNDHLYVSAGAKLQDKALTMALEMAN